MTGRARHGGRGWSRSRVVRREENTGSADEIWGRWWGNEAYPKRRSGWDMKSVMRSSMLRGSRTNVGNVTLCRSIPTLAHHISRGRTTGMGTGKYAGGGGGVNGRTSAER